MNNVQKRPEGRTRVKNNELYSSAIFKAVFAGLELVALVIPPIVSAINRAGADPDYSLFTYRDGLLIYLLLLSPAIVYVMANVIFSTIQLHRARKGYTPASLKKYSAFSLVLLIGGSLVGLLYGFLFLPFLVENLVPFIAYRKEIRSLQEKP